ncbi:hypothetical protein [Paenibacillus alginolyticus]|uniref:Uncharacterized protein n=1 Tax=Paenibacillus alginolyticus TaxID=59839 RepID=A0ABT4GDA0_9BACL|nr:hypothetical protein [Paenibacillus alginolyticus]MCY9694144.1 hypothetical protein [Paenibacillus alginolyticus]MEC0143602.1 hypothetical protein [Paenibacillus alginolyticus]
MKKMLFCPCGSGKDQDDCHPNLSPNEIKKTIRHRSNIREGQVEFLKLFDTGAFKRSEYSGHLRVAFVSTPAGKIFYPLMVFLGNSAIRPLTIDGEIIIEEFCTIHCMLTPQHFASIVFNVKELLGEKGKKVRLVKCTIATVGRPFDSVFAIEANLSKQRIALYHHTNEEAGEKIISSKFMRGSKWNIQGTEELEELGHIYMTDIQRIEDDRDIWDIAMCDKGTRINIISDNQDQENIEVYRDNPKNRPVSLKIWVPLDFVSPNHLILHNGGSHTQTSQFGSYSWWEVFMPSIYRIAVKRDTGLPLTLITKKNDLLFIKSDNLQGNENFLAALGSDMYSLRKVWSEKATPRVNPKPADFGQLDVEWQEVWRKNLCSIINDIMKDSLDTIWMG